MLGRNRSNSMIQFDECYRVIPTLDNATVDSVWSHVVRLIDHPKAFPLLEEQAEVFGRVHQLFSPTFRNC